MASLAPGKFSQVRFAKTVVLAGMNYYLAILLRDETYWPIVTQVYSEVHGTNYKRLY